MDTALSHAPLPRSCRLCNARGQPQDGLDTFSPEQLRHEYNVIVCGQGSLDEHFSGGEMSCPPPLPAVPVALV